MSMLTAFALPVPMEPPIRRPIPFELRKHVTGFDKGLASQTLDGVNGTYSSGLHIGEGSCAFAKLRIAEFLSPVVDTPRASHSQQLTKVLS
eukprot:4605564-Amphidinium_carterae.1